MSVVPAGSSAEVVGPAVGQQRDHHEVVEVVGEHGLAAGSAAAGSSGTVMQEGGERRGAGREAEAS